MLCLARLFFFPGKRKKIPQRSSIRNHYLPSSSLSSTTETRKKANEIRGSLLLRRVGLEREGRRLSPPPSTLALLLLNPERRIDPSTDRASMGGLDDVSSETSFLLCLEIWRKERRGETRRRSDRELEVRRRRSIKERLTVVSLDLALSSGVVGSGQLVEGVV